MGRRNTRVRGHTLASEGAAHDKAGNYMGRGGRAGYGHCSCGAWSELEFSDSARRRWHAEHKADVVAEGSKEGGDR